MSNARAQNIHLKPRKYWNSKVTMLSVKLDEDMLAIEGGASTNCVFI